MRTITIRYTAFRDCPNCEGRGDDGASWRPAECKRCKGKGKLVTGVEVEDSLSGVLPGSSYDFNATGEVFLIDFDEDEEFEVRRAGSA
jgi:hypothetical protein